MTPDELAEYLGAISADYGAWANLLAKIGPASDSEESSDHHEDVLVEGVFFRAFARYESALERLFLHYVTGGRSRGGLQANSRLHVTEEALARRMTRAGFRFLPWAKPDAIRANVDLYIEDGWPISDVLRGKSQDLSEANKIRNRIAHNSVESVTGFNAVQRQLFGTERPFGITPGQLLRVRSKKWKKLYVEHYSSAMEDTLLRVIDPGD